MADRHSLIRAFERGGLARDAAEEIATEIFDIVHENVATKADLRELELRLKVWTGSLFTAVVVILAGVMTLFHFLAGGGQ